jgi:hypothetical protein
MTCFMVSQNSIEQESDEPVFVLGGRFGDIIQMLPCCGEIFRRTGKRPIMVSSTQYANVYDGVSYVQSFPMDLPWWEGLVRMAQIAQERFHGGVIIQWWNAPELAGKLIPEQAKGATILQCHGINHGVNLAEWPDYGTSMASRCGFARDEWRNLPLVFDKRDRGREAQLLYAVRGRDTKPILLINFNGHSSPFAAVPEVMREVNKLKGRFNIVDIGRLKATRIFDLLGLYDAALGLLTIDTATLHLAQASKIPYIAWTVDGWTSSVPKGNCVKEIKYSQAVPRVGEVVATLESWLNPAAPAPVMATGGGGGRATVIA